MHVNPHNPPQLRFHHAAILVNSSQVVRSTCNIRAQHLWRFYVSGMVISAVMVVVIADVKWNVALELFHIESIFKLYLLFKPPELPWRRQSWSMTINSRARRRTSPSL